MKSRRRRPKAGLPARNAGATSLDATLSRTEKSPQLHLCARSSKTGGFRSDAVRVPAVRTFRQRAQTGPPWTTLRPAAWGVYLARAQMRVDLRHSLLVLFAFFFLRSAAVRPRNTLIHKIL